MCFNLFFVDIRIEMGINLPKRVAIAIVRLLIFVTWLLQFMGTINIANFSRKCTNLIGADLVMGMLP